MSERAKHTNVIKFDYVLLVDLERSVVTIFKDSVRMNERLEAVIWGRLHGPDKAQDQ